MALRLVTLGGLRFFKDDVELVQLPAQRLRAAMLVYLAIEGETSRETLTAMFWPEKESEKARHALSQTLYELRRALGEDWVEVQGDRVRVTSRVEIDADAFTEGVERGDYTGALELDAGPFLGGFFLADSRAFEEWVDRQRARWLRLHRRAHRERILQLLASGDAAGALAVAHRWVEHDPLDDEAQQKLIELLAASGERTAALRQYGVYERLLAEDGLEPLDEAKALVARIREGEEKARPLTGAPQPVAWAAERTEASTTAEPVAAASPSAPHPQHPFLNLFRELKRRHVIKVATVYLIVAWFLLQSTSLLVPTLLLPGWTTRLVLVLTLVGFPIALILAWAFEITPEGTVRRAEPLGPTDAAALIYRSLLRWRGAPLGAIAVLLGVGLWSILTAPDGSESPSSNGMRLDPTRVAVLYFEDLSEGRKLEHLANGLTVQLIQELSPVEELTVISSGGVQPYRGRSVPVDSIAQALRVGTLVMGSIQGAGESLRVNFQLVDGSTGQELHSDRLERPYRELLALQDEVAAEVARGIRSAIGREVKLRRTRQQTRSVAAWELVQRAEQLRDEAARLRSYGDSVAGVAAQGRLQVADSLLAGAEQQDPDWAEPVIVRGWIAFERAQLMELTTSPFDLGAHVQWLRTGLTHAERVLADSPRHAAALELRGRVRVLLSRRLTGTPGAQDLLDQAEADLRAALELEPTRARAWSALSEALQLKADFAEANLSARRALEEDAYLQEAVDVVDRLFFTSMGLERFGEARNWCETGRRDFPGERRFLVCELHLMAYTDALSPDVNRAWQIVREEERLLTAQRKSQLRPYRELEVAAILARAGRGDSARALIRQAREHAQPLPDVRQRVLYDEAVVRHRLGETDEAIRLLRDWAQTRARGREYLAHDYNFRDLRSDPRFRELILPRDSASPRPEN